MRRVWRRAGSLGRASRGVIRLSLLLALAAAAVYALLRPAPVAPLPVHVIRSERLGPSDDGGAALLAALGLDPRDGHVRFVGAGDAALATDPAEAVRRLAEGGRVLFLLRRPTDDGMKRLRAAVENAFVGAGRAEALRRIVPVMAVEAPAPDAAGWRRVEDDMIYACDNFGGIGLLLRDDDAALLAGYGRRYEATRPGCAARLGR